MIQATASQNFSAYIQTKDNRIQTSGNYTLAHLFKFTNDMDKSVQYAYPATETIFERYTKSDFTYNATPDVFTGKINLNAGYWKYEVYEVAFLKGGSINSNTAPATESFVFNPLGQNGAVQGIVTKGKMYVSEKEGSQEVRYSESAKSVQTITIINGGAGYTSAPTIEITGGGFITEATAVCDIDGGQVVEVVITHAGNGYTSNPTVELSGGGFTTQAQLSASLEETNYIYTG